MPSGCSTLLRMDLKHDQEEQLMKMGSVLNSVMLCCAGGGVGHRQRREGELEGIDEDFDDTQVEVKLQGISSSPRLSVAAAAPWVYQLYLHQVSIRKGSATVVCSTCAAVSITLQCLASCMNSLFMKRKSIRDHAVIGVHSLQAVRSF